MIKVISKVLEEKVVSMLKKGISLQAICNLQEISREQLTKIRAKYGIKPQDKKRVWRQFDSFGSSK